MSGNLGAESALFLQNPEAASRLRRQRVAEALLRQGQEATPIRAHSQGIARIAQSLMGGLELGVLDREARDEANAYRTEAANSPILRALVGGGSLTASSAPATAPTASSAVSAPPATMPPATARGEAPQAVAQGIAERRALDPNSPTYAEDIQQINNRVVGQTPGLSGLPPQPIAREAATSAPLATSPQSFPSGQQMLLSALAGLQSPNPLIRQQAQTLMPVFQGMMAREDNQSFQREGRVERREESALDRQLRERGLQLQERGLGIQERQAERQERQADRPTVGLNPIYGQDAQGNPVIMLSDNRGNIIQPQLPSGVRATTPTREIDLGTSRLTVDRAGNPIVNREVNIRGRESEEQIGTAQGQQAAAAPRAVEGADRSLRMLDEVANHPALRTSTGMLSFTGAIPGTPMADFATRVDQLRGGAFLDAFNQLRGGGQITEVEGRKATDAIARLNRSVSPSDFRQALQDLREVIETGRQRALRAGTQSGTMPIGTTGRTADPPAQRDEAAPRRLRYNPATGELE